MLLLASLGGMEMEMEMVINVSEQDFTLLDP